MKEIITSAYRKISSDALSFFNERKVWEFLNSKPFYNPDFDPQFSSAKDIFDRFIAPDPVVLENYKKFQGSGETGSHPSELRNKRRRDVYDQLRKI